jgi:tetratricopeptide (TPR) repeat protein
VKTAPSGVNPTDTGSSGAAQAGIPDERMRLAGRARELERQLERLPENDPDRMRLRYNLGCTYQRLGEDEKAVAEFEAALHADSEPSLVRAWALWNLGSVKHLQGRKAMQANDFDQAAAKLDEAERYYREALRMQPGLPALGLNQEMVLADRQLNEKMKQAMEELARKLARAREETQQALAEQQKVDGAETDTDRDNALQQAQQQTQEAEAAARDVADFIDQLQASQPQQKPNIGKAAAEELAQAGAAQEQAGYKVRTDASRDEKLAEATTHLKNAAAMLGAAEQQMADSQQQPQPSGQGQEDQPQQSDASQTPTPQDGQEGQATDDENLMQQLAQQQQAAAGQVTGEPGDEQKPFDEEQARALLMRMQDEEEDLREAIKQYRARQYRAQEPGKNW